MRIPPLFSRHLCIIALAFLALANVVHADDASDVHRLHQSGQSTEAIALARRYLVTRPDDAAIQFKLGVMLAESQYNTEATEIFSKLSRERPDLPEPMNNLAAMLASAGRLDEARQALESALRARPTFVTALDNLGDIYSRLALQAYSRALAGEPGRAGLASKLALARELAGQAVLQAPTSGASVPAR
jgi:colicin import membrane protein